MSAPRKPDLSLGILDTSAVIRLDRVDPEQLPHHPVITAVTLAELSVGSLVARDPRERATRQALLQWAESSFDPLPFDADAARGFGSVAAALRRSRRKTAARAYDAMIAAIAIANALPLHTCNPRDFSRIPGLDLRPLPVP